VARRSRLIAGGLVAGLAAATVGSCSVARMNTVVGRHAIIHWDPEQRSLCGGTLEYVDATLEVVADTYAVQLPARPAIEVVWDGEGLLARGLCAAGFGAGGCDVPFPNGTNLMVVSDVTNPHELTHAVRLTGATHGMPALFGEGVAVRWEPGPSRKDWGMADAIQDLDYEQIRALLDHRRLEGEWYPNAGQLWAWLEAEHGGPTMASFAGRLGRLADLGLERRPARAVVGSEHLRGRGRGQHSRSGRPVRTPRAARRAARVSDRDRRPAGHGDPPRSLYRSRAAV
jgi:hypothetical protein